MQRENNATIVGVVKWFDCRRGFGFIIGEHGGDIFVHHSVIEGKGFRFLCEGDKVEYVPAQGPKGTIATRVRMLEEVDGAEGNSDEEPGNPISPIPAPR